VDEVREMEDLPPLGGDAAELPPPPNQSIPAKQSGQKYNNEAMPTEDEQDEQATATDLRPLITDAAERIVAAEIKGLSRRAGKAAENRQQFDEWAQQWYIKHADYAAKALTPLFSAAQSNLSPLVAADEYCTLSMKELTGHDVPAMLAEWKLTKPCRLAHILETALCPN